MTHPGHIHPGYINGCTVWRRVVCTLWRAA